MSEAENIKPSGLVKRKVKKVEDLTQTEVKINVPDRKKPAVIARIPDPVINYNNPTRIRSRTSFNPPEYDLAQIGRIEDVEAYVREAFGKKITLMFKEGWDFVGKNPKTIQYIKLRLAQIAQASNTPTLKLFRDIGASLIKKSNSLVVKSRNIESSGGKERQVPGTKKTLKPVAGYFTAPAETMEFKMSGNAIARWQQNMPSGDYKEFSPDDIVHFYYNKKDGFVFGTPTLIPVIDDIRALRKIEEHIELLIHQHLFPLFQWKVGTPEMPAGVTETGEREVDIVKREVQYLASEGGVVTTERHDIKAIGAEGRALRAEGYLTHFKRRVFAGLGLSAMDLGESETANRSTSETLSQNLIDSIKDFQQVFEMFFNEYIIKELLLESSFPFDVFDDDNKVEIKFREIDLESQIKKENHATDLFNKDTVTIHEARRMMGKEPIVLPTPEEIDNSQDGPDRYPDWYAMRWSLFERPKLLIQSVDEAYTQLSKARTAAESTFQKEMSVKSTPSPTKSTPVKNEAEHKFVLNDEILTKQYKVAKMAAIEYVQIHNNADMNLLSEYIRTSLTPALDKLYTQQVKRFSDGYKSISPTNTDIFIKSMRTVRPFLRERVDKYVNKLVKDVVRGIRRHKDKDIGIVFDSFGYRTKFIEDVELSKSYNFGQVVAYRHMGLKELDVDVSDKSCSKCGIYFGEKLNTSYNLLSDVPPFHSSCTCKLKVKLKDFSAEEEIKNAKIDEDGERDINIKDKEQSLSKCEKMMIRSLISQDPNITQATAIRLAKGACSQSNDDNINDATKKERCVLQVKQDLRKRHGSWSDKKIKSTAWAICNSKLK